MVSAQRVRGSGDLPLMTLEAVVVMALPLRCGGGGKEV